MVRFFEEIINGGVPCLLVDSFSATGLLRWWQITAQEVDAFSLRQVRDESPVTLSEHIRPN